MGTMYGPPTRKDLNLIPNPDREPDLYDRIAGLYHLGRIGAQSNSQGCPVHHSLHAFTEAHALLFSVTQDFLLI